MQYIVITVTGITFTIDEETRKLIITEGAGGKSVHIFPNGEVLSLKPFPNIVLASRYAVMDEEKLTRTKQYRCVYGRVHEIEEKCECGSACKGLKKSDAFRPLIQIAKMQPDMKKKYEALLESMKMPAISHGDIKHEERLLGKPSRKSIPSPKQK